MLLIAFPTEQNNDKLCSEVHILSDFFFLDYISVFFSVPFERNLFLIYQFVKIKQFSPKI
jgi:hypothetical protein